MKVLGIDPGVTTGWCLYDTEARRAISSGTFEEWRLDPMIPNPDLVVIERPKGYGPTRPQLVDCGYIAGRLRERCARFMDAGMVEELTRREVCQTLTEAMHGQCLVRNDATAWAALCELHGGPLAGKKGGPMHGVKSHGRAALAVAVAWAIRNETQRLHLTSYQVAAYAAEALPAFREKLEDRKKREPNA